MVDGSPGQAQRLADRYRLDELLGQGGMARVYRAQDERLNRPVAVKVFDRPRSRQAVPGVPAPAAADSTPRDPDAGGASAAERAEAERWTVEARALAGLNHAGIVRIYDAAVADDEQPYVVMQLITGETLSARLHRDGPLPPDEVVALGVRVAAALEHVHANGIVHRDVKPSNILLDEAGLPYLADFGIARPMDTSRMTAAGQLLGTAAYLAPEQVQGEEPGPPCDIYALGLVLLECLTGRQEYVGIGIETALARLHRPPAIPPELPAPLRSVIAAMTAAEPAARPTAGEVAHRLAHPGEEAALAAAGPSTAVLALPPAADTGFAPGGPAANAPTGQIPAAGPPRSATHRRAAWMAAPLVAAAVVAVALTAALLATRHHDHNKPKPPPVSQQTTSSTVTPSRDSGNNGGNDNQPTGQPTTQQPTSQPTTDRPSPTSSPSPSSKPTDGPTASSSPTAKASSSPSPGTGGGGGGDGGGH
jgi:eukaryotic-like serine/threonine-protein kinase